MEHGIGKTLEPKWRQLLTIARSNLERLSLLIDDILSIEKVGSSMPGMNGDEVLTTLRQREDTRQIPAVFMTASVMPGHVTMLKELGAIDVFAKPFDPLALPAMLQEAWGKHQGS